MCQDEDENEPEDEFFRSFRIKTVTNEPGPQYYDTLKDRFVRHAQVPERTKALVFVFVFVFVLAHEQAISIYSIYRGRKTRLVFVLVVCMKACLCK